MQSTDTQFPRLKWETTLYIRQTQLVEFHRSHESVPVSKTIIKSQNIYIHWKTRELVSALSYRQVVRTCTVHLAQRALDNRKCALRQYRCFEFFLTSIYQTWGYVKISKCNLIYVMLKLFSTWIDYVKPLLNKLMGFFSDLSDRKSSTVINWHL